MNGLGPLDTLLAIEEIKSLKARYFRFIDTRDWSGFRSLFSDDCTFDFSQAFGDIAPPPTVSATDPTKESVDNFVESLKVSLSGVLTIHHGHMPEIEITGPNSAQGVWAMYDYIRRPAGRRSPSIEGYGHYHEDYVKVGDRWLISSVRLTRLSVAEL